MKHSCGSGFGVCLWTYRLECLQELLADMGISLSLNFRFFRIAALPVFDICVQRPSFIAMNDPQNLGF